MHTDDIITQNKEEKEKKAARMEIKVKVEETFLLSLPLRSLCEHVSCFRPCESHLQLADERVRGPGGELKSAEKLACDVVSLCWCNH